MLEGIVTRVASALVVILTAYGQCCPIARAAEVLATRPPCAEADDLAALGDR